ncbi:hypothetical protein QAD02_007884 [Eretmocerus hayati]|uniref:Uncharacterized protein n=1 Tax=Eretmocerus hayati TaxID=131215 RepID=A0ACC2N7B3_9HYME|nr:hypothetical protein QAD02_007884 [Eretmocerus hayati]
MLSEDEMSFGPLVDEAFEQLTVDEETIKQTKRDCRKFFIASYVSIKKRFEIEDKRPLLLRSITPENALSQRFHEHFPTLNHVLEYYPRIRGPDIDIDAMNGEWADLLERAGNLPDEVMTRAHDPIGLWHMLGNVEDAEGVPLFHNLCYVVYRASSIPYSNASPERSWSEYNLVETSLRCSLLLQTVRGSILAKQLIRFVGGSAKFEPDKDMLYRIDSNMYATEQVNEDMTEGDMNIAREVYGVDAEFRNRCGAYEVLYGRGENNLRDESDESDKSNDSDESDDDSN